jgi:DNA-binding SARP family transcriptional activator
VEYRVLGPLEVSDGERRVELGGRMQRAILALLLVDANRVVPVDRIGEALWPEGPPPTAPTALQGYVAALRRALEPRRAPRTPARVLVTQPPGYLLRVQPGALDAARFEALAASGRADLVAGRPHEAREALHEALGLWRGSPYADLAFETFVQPEIARLDERRATVTEDLMEASLALGEHAAAVAELERLTAAEPLRERRWEMLMLALYRCGRQADALRAAAQARTRLAEELGIDPRPSLRELEAAILRQDRSLDWHPPAPEPPPVRQPLARPGPTLVGRQDELAALDQAVDRAVAGQGRIVLVSGEPGIGKTRLVEEVARRAAPRAVTVAWGRCVEGEMPAFWPWTQLVRSLADELEPSTVRAALVTGAADIAQVVPEVKELVGPIEAPDVLDAESARLRLYEAVASFLARLAQDRPLLLVFDDLQWGDLPSTRLLQYLAVPIASARIALVATYRDADVGLDHPLTPVLGALARAPATTRLRLSGLAGADVARLAADAAESAVPAEVVSDLHRRTEGNPFFVVELLRLMRNAGDEGPDLLRGAIPVGVRDVIRHRVGMLSQASTALLSVAAVVGRDFDLDVLAHAAGPVDQDRLIELVEEPLAAALIAERADRPGSLRFSHDLVRETVYDQLTALRRARVHRRVGDAFEAVGRTGGPDTAAIADHYWKGIPAGAADKAFDYALRTAQQHTAALAYEQAEEHLRRALSLLDRLPADGQRRRRELAAQEALGFVLLMTRGYCAPAVGEAVARAVDLCRQLDDGDRLLVATWRLLSFHILRADYGSTAELAASLLERPEATHDPLFAATGHRALGAVRLSQGDLLPARDHLETVIGLLADDRHAPLVAAFEVHPAAFARDFLALDLWLLGETQRAEDVMAEAVETARDRDHPFSLSFSLYFAAVLGVLEGDAAIARANAEMSIELAARHGYRLLHAVAGALGGWADVEHGDVDGGTRRLRQALSAAAETGALQWRHFVLALLAHAVWRRGRPRAALTVLDKALDHAQATGERFYEPEIHRLRGEILLAVPGEGKRAEAEGALSRAMAVARGQGSVVFLGRAQSDLDRL